MMNKIVKSIHTLTTKMEGEQVVFSLSTVLKGDNIPIEQLRGDINRAGYQVNRLLALDIDSRRLFFTDPESNFLYAEFAAADQGYQVLKVGHQREIAKEYDPVDLEADDSEELITTEHEEADYAENTPGMIPAGTPGDKPTDENVLDEQGDHASGQGWGDEEKHEGRRDLNRSVAETLAEVQKMIGTGTG